MTASIFNIPPPSHPSGKTNIFHSQIPPSYLDPTQPPTKRTPYRQIRNVPFLRDVRICMPSSLSQHLFCDGSTSSSTSSNANSKPPYTSMYHKVHLSLSNILASHPLRTGNYTMLAEPSPPDANSTTMTLLNGTLNLSMPAHIYQRSGLADSPAFKVTQVQSGGRKHDTTSKTWKVEIDLRQPSMVKGRKGFDRLLHAAMSVDGLKETRVWVVAETAREGCTGARKRKRAEEQDGKQQGEVDQPASTTTTTTTGKAASAPATASTATTVTEISLSPADVHEDASNPLSQHHPTTINNRGTHSQLQNTLIPHLVSHPSFLSTISDTNPNHSQQKAALPGLLEEDMHELSEYLGLMFLQSPMITRDEYNRVDPGICRYRIPGEEEDSEVDVADVMMTTWAGFMGGDFVTDLLLDLIRRSRLSGNGGGGAETGMWAAVQVVAHRTEAVGGIDGYVILLQGGAADGSMVKVEQAQEKGRGFAHVTCFEYVDSNLL